MSEHRAAADTRDHRATWRQVNRPSHRLRKNSQETTGETSGTNMEHGEYEDYIVENTIIHEGPPVRYRLTPRKTRLDGSGEESRLRKWTQGPQSYLETTQQRPKPRHQDTVSPEGITMATSSKVSTKYKDIISQSTLILPGSPVLYQLKPKEEKIGTLTRKTVGEKNQDKVNKTILLVGETGTGKSTLINALFNYAMAVKFEDDIWFEIVEDEKRSPCESQTSDVAVYEIFGFEDQTLPFSLTIIDTPGFGDTRGIEHDAIVSQRLFDLFSSEDGVHELSAVGLVMKATENRLNDRLRYIFDSVTSLFGNDMEKNIVALITHSDGLTPENALEALDAAKIQCPINQKHQPVHFLFNNQQKTQRTEETEFSLEFGWKITMKGLSQFKDSLEKHEPQKLMTTVEVLKSRIRLTACVQNLQERIQLIELKQTVIRQIEEAKKKHDLKKDDKFTVEVDEPYKVREKISGGKWLLFFYKGAVTCKVCEENCHYPGCTMAACASHCEVMRGGRCTSCTNKCPASDHVKETWRYVNKTRKVVKVDTAVLENLEKEMEKLKAEKSQCLEEAYQHVVRLDQIALNVKSVSTHVHLDFLIEKMKEKGDTEKIQKLEEVKRGMDEGIIMAGVHYLYGKLTTTTKEKRPKPRHQDPVSPKGITMATISKVSTKYKDIISKSYLMRSGSPALYQLRPKEEKIGPLTRKTVGEKNLNKVNKTILLVGETDAGKSTLINALVNYAMGVKFEDNIWFEIVEDEKRSWCESQTSDVVVYEIFGFEGQTLPFSLTIIDTPGFGNTRGIEHDVIVSQRLFDLFRSEDGVHELSAVGLVMKASVNRLSDRLMYIFNSVMSLFGNDMEKNIVALITHSDGLTPKNALEALDAAKMKCARDQKNQPVYFLFDNKQKTQRKEMTLRTQRSERALKHAWETTHDEMGQFTEFLEATTPQKLMTTIEVLNLRIRLTACVQKLQERIQLIELKQTEIRQMCKCPVSDHVKEKWIYDTKTRKVDKTLQDIKDKYEKNKAESEKKSSLLENLEKEMEDLTAMKDQCLEEAYQHVVRLDQIALNVKSVSTHVHLDFLIKKMKEKGDREKIQKLEEINSCMDGGNMAGVHSLYGKLTTAGKAVKEKVKFFTVSK